MVSYRMGRCRGFILWRSIFGWSEGDRLEWWANRTWPLRLTSFRRCFPWRHALVGFVCYGAPGLLGLEALQLTCRGLGGPGRSAVLLREIRSRQTVYLPIAPSTLEGVWAVKRRTG